MRLCYALVVAMLVGVVLSETDLPSVDAPSAEFLEEDVVEDIHQDDVSAAEAEVAEEKAQVNKEMKSLLHSGSSMMKKWKAQEAKDSVKTADVQPVTEDLEEVDEAEPVNAADLDPRFAHHHSQSHFDEDYAAIFHHKKAHTKNAPKLDYRPEGRNAADMGEVEAADAVLNKGKDESSSKFIVKEVAKEVEHEEEVEPEEFSHHKSKRNNVQEQKAQLKEEALALKKQNMIMLRESKARRAKRRAQETKKGLHEAAKLMGKKVIGQYLGQKQDKEAKKWLGHMKMYRTMPTSWTKKPKKLSERQEKKKVHKNINWVKKALNMPPDETDMEAATGTQPDHQAEKWMGMIPSGRSHKKKKSVMVQEIQDEDEVQDPRGHHHASPPHTLFIRKESNRRFKNGTKRPPQLRMMTEEEREKEEAMADDARRAKEHKKRSRELKDSRERQNLERNPIVRNAKPIALPHVKPHLPKVHLPNAEEEEAMDKAARAAIRAQSRDRRKAMRRASKKRAVALAQQQPVKKHKKLSADEYKRQLHNRVVNNPVFKHARLYGLLKPKKTQKKAKKTADGLTSKHKGLLTLAGLNSARKKGFQHISLDFGLDNN